jgi:hypothetical protein
MRKLFLSFADSRMSVALKRIRMQAEVMGCYDQIVVADESYLNINFREKYKDKLRPGIRGYGYWCWKPQVILQLLDQVNEGDIVQYTDAGCHLNPQGILRLSEYFELANSSESGILAFAATPPSFHDPLISLPDLSDYKWCKADLFHFMNVYEDDLITRTPTVTAGVIFIKKCAESQKIIRNWLDIMAADFHLLDDTSSIRPNIPGFIEHRHDQSIFSILCKLNKVSMVSCYEYGYPSRRTNMPNWEILENYPIHAKRDKGLEINQRMIDIAKKINRRLKRLFG